METQGMALDLGGVLEIAIPVILGAIVGLLLKKWAYPRMHALLGRFGKAVTSPANRLLSIFGILVWLGLAVACHSSNAPATLAWLEAHPLLPFRPTLDILRYVFLFSTFVCVQNLVLLPSDPSGQEGEGPADSFAGKRS